MVKKRVSSAQLAPEPKHAFTANNSNSRPKKLLAITYPGHEPKRNLTNASRNCYAHKEATLLTDCKKRGRSMDSYFPVKWSALSKKYVKRCIAITWAFLQACVTLGCLFLVYLFFHPDYLSSERLQVEVLNITLRQHLVGQDIAINRTVAAIARYLGSGVSIPPLPLVLVYAGCSGCGKTYMLSLIAKHCPHTEALVASHQVALARRTGDNLLHWLQSTLSSRRPNIIVIDDVDLTPDPAKLGPGERSFSAQLETVLSSWAHLRRQTGQATILVLSLSGGASVAEGFALKLLSDKQNIIGSEDIEELVEAYRYMLPPWLKNAEIVPFLPLTKADVKECLLRQLAQHTPEFRARVLALPGGVNSLLEEFRFYPAQNPVFSESGCKEVPIKLALVATDSP
uniref:AAA+ ATPase domain-containing protein n=1 Tax=Amblyomma maculatum TaxID=34609 RepID=G3MSV5_AMBMU